MKIIQKETNNYQLPAELEIELSIIDSGMIITNINDEIVIILKDTNKMTSSLSELISVNLKFTYIDRPEFPAVNSELRLKTSKELSVKYDYFFNFESEFEMNLLSEILNQKVISLFLFSDIVVKHFGIELEDEDKLHLSSVLKEVSS